MTRPGRAHPTRQGDRAMAVDANIRETTIGRSSLDP